MLKMNLIEEQRLNAKFELGEGLIYEDFQEPNSRVAGLIHGPDDWPGPVKLIRQRHPYYLFDADWHLPEPLEFPSRYTSMKRALEAAAKHLSPKALEGFKFKKRSTVEAPEPAPRKVQKEDFRGKQDDVFCRAMKYTDGSTEFVYSSVEKFPGKVVLYQSPKREVVMTITQKPKGMQVSDNWTNVDQLLQYLAETDKSKLFG